MTNLLGIFTQQRQLAETLMKAGVDFSSPPIRVCVVCCADHITIYHIVMLTTFVSNVQPQIMIIIFCYGHGITNNISIILINKPQRKPKLLR